MPHYPQTLITESANTYQHSLSYSSVYYKDRTCLTLGARCCTRWQTAALLLSKKSSGSGISHPPHCSPHILTHTQTHTSSHLHWSSARWGGTLRAGLNPMCCFSFWVLESVSCQTSCGYSAPSGCSYVSLQFIHVIIYGTVVLIIGLLVWSCWWGNGAKWHRKSTLKQSTDFSFFLLGLLVVRCIFSVSNDKWRQLREQ